MTVPRALSVLVSVVLAVFLSPGAAAPGPRNNHRDDRGKEFHARRTFEGARQSGGGMVFTAY
jgi:hypothetical protein